MRRIQKEHKILNTSLPDGIFVRTWDARLDLLRVLIVGLKDSIRAGAFRNGLPIRLVIPTVTSGCLLPFLDGWNRPNQPNLYEDGKICLSLLGTWPADAKNEGWSTNRSSMLQIIVSLMGLVLVKEPYYNGPALMLLSVQKSR
jgi:ubiquitin-conjugating enzyme E2 O